MGKAGDRAQGCRKEESCWCVFVYRTTSQRQWSKNIPTLKTHGVHFVNVVPEWGCKEEAQFPKCSSDLNRHEKRIIDFFLLLLFYLLLEQKEAVLMTFLNRAGVWKFTKEIQNINWKRNFSAPVISLEHFMSGEMTALVEFQTDLSGHFAKESTCQNLCPDLLGTKQIDALLIQRVCSRRIIWCAEASCLEQEAQEEVKTVGLEHPLQTQNTVSLLQSKYWK